MAVDSSPTKDTASPNAPGQPAARKDSPAAACVGTCSTSELASDTATSSESEQAPSAQLQAPLDTMSISQKDTSISGDASMAQPCNEGSHLGSDSRRGNSHSGAVSSLAHPAEKVTSSSKDQDGPVAVSAQQEDKGAADLIKAEKQAEVPKTAVTGTATPDVATSTTHAPLTAASKSGETQDQPISSESSGYHAAASAPVSSSHSSSSSGSARDTPAPTQGPRSPRLAPAQASGEVTEGLQLGITHIADGVRIENCPRGCHVAIYSPNFVRVTSQPPVSRVFSFGEVVGPGLHFKVMDDGGICGVQLPEGTQASVRLVPAVHGLEAGIGGGGAAVESIFVTVDGYSVVFRFSL